MSDQVGTPNCWFSHAQAHICVHCAALLYMIVTYYTPVFAIIKPVRLVSHWHANSSRLFREFSRGSFARHSCECRENFHVSRTSREGFQHVEKFYAIFFLQNISQDCRVTVVRRSRDVRASVANLSPQISANLQCEIFATLVRMSRECRTTVARQSCENLATIWRENKTKRHSYECRATLARMSPDCRTNLNENIFKN